MKKIIRINENDINNMVRTAINEISGTEIDGFTPSEVRNMLGDYDDPELNKAVETENAENFQEKVVSVLQGQCQCKDIYGKLSYFFFPHVMDALDEKLNLEYQGWTENEGYVFENDKYQVILYPVDFYEVPADFRLKNIQVFTSDSVQENKNRKRYNMKKTIRLSENKLHNIIKESVKLVLREAYEDKISHINDAFDFYANKVSCGQKLSEEQLAQIQEMYDFLIDTNAHDNELVTDYLIPMAQNFLNSRNPDDGLPEV